MHATVEYRKGLTCRLLTKAQFGKRSGKERIYWVKVMEIYLQPTRLVKPRVSLTVNGDKVEKEVSVRMLLSDFIRHELGLTGTHVDVSMGFGRSNNR